MDLTLPTHRLLILYNTVPKRGRGEENKQTNKPKKKAVPPYCTEFYVQSTILHSLIYTPYIYWCRRQENSGKLVLARTFHPTTRTTAADNPRLGQKTTVPTLCQTDCPALRQEPRKRRRDPRKSEVDFGTRPL